MFKHLIPFIDVQTKTRLLVASRSVRDLVKPTFSPAFFNVQINLHDVKVAQQALSEIAAKEIRRQNRLTVRAYRLLLLIGALLRSRRLGRGCGRPCIFRGGEQF